MQRGTCGRLLCTNICTLVSEDSLLFLLPLVQSFVGCRKKLSVVKVLLFLADQQEETHDDYYQLSSCEDLPTNK